MITRKMLELVRDDPGKGCSAHLSEDQSRELAALCLELADALAEQVRRCESCAGDGVIETEDMDGKRGEMACPNCQESRALLARLEG